MHLGLRNFTLIQIQELLNVVKLKPIIVQAELNLYIQQKKLRNFCTNNNITVCAIYPFGSPYSSSRNLPSPTQHRSVKSIAHKLDTSTKAVLLRYLLVYDIPIVIDNTMAKGAAHLLQTVYEIKLDEKHIEKLSTIQQNKPERVLTEFELWSSSLLDKMGNKSSLMLQEQDIRDIQAETGFLPSQIERLYSRFTSLDKGDSGTLSREDFLRIPELAINPLGDRIVHAFFKESEDDHVNFRQFVRVLAHFRPIKKTQDNKLNAREEKLRFAFKMYDLDDDERISREELLAVLHMMVGENISDDQLNSIAERTILEADRDGDQMISFEEFCSALERTDVEQKMSIKFLK